MAKTNAANRVASTRNPFIGKSVAEMKKIYDDKYRGKNLSAAQLTKVADQMQAAKKALSTAKPKPAASKPAARKQMPGGTTRAQLEKSFNKAKAINNFVGPGGSRTREDLKNNAKKSTPKKRTVKGRAVKRRK